MGTRSGPMSPKPCEEPGCIATLVRSSWPNSESASTTNSAPWPPAAPAITKASDTSSLASTSSASRRTSAGAIPTRVTSAPASLAAAASAKELTS